MGAKVFIISYNINTVIFNNNNNVPSSYFFNVDDYYTYKTYTYKTDSISCKFIQLT